MTHEPHPTMPTVTASKPTYIPTEEVFYWDDGAGSGKWMKEDGTTGCFPSTVTEFSPDFADLCPLGNGVFEWDGAKYTHGDNEYDLSDERYTKKEAKARLVAALIAAGIPDGSVLTLHAGVQSQAPEAYIKKVGQHLTDTYTYRTEKGEFTVEVKEAHVLPQGKAAARHIAATVHDFNECGIIVYGNFTQEAVFLDPKRRVVVKKAFKGGAARLAQDYIDEIGGKYGFHTNHLSQTVLNQVIEEGGDLAAIKRKKGDPKLLKDLLTETLTPPISYLRDLGEQKYRIGRDFPIYLSGGGAALALALGLDIPGVIIREDGKYDVVRGFAARV